MGLEPEVHVVAGRPMPARARAAAPHHLADVGAGGVRDQLEPLGDPAGHVADRGERARQRGDQLGVVHHLLGHVEGGAGRDRIDLRRLEMAALGGSVHDRDGRAPPSAAELLRRVGRVGDDGVRAAHDDSLGGVGDGLQPGRAEPVDRHRRRRDRNAGAQAGDAGDVEALFGLRHRAAEDEILHLRRIGRILGG